MTVDDRYQKLYDPYLPRSYGDSNIKTGTSYLFIIDYFSYNQMLETPVFDRFLRDISI